MFWYREVGRAVAVFATIFAVRLEILFFFIGVQVFLKESNYFLQESKAQFHILCGFSHCGDHKAVRSAAVDHGKIKNSASGIEVS